MQSRPSVKKILKKPSQLISWEKCNFIYIYIYIYIYIKMRNTPLNPKIFTCSIHWNSEQYHNVLWVFQNLSWQSTHLSYSIKVQNTFKSFLLTWLQPVQHTSQVVRSGDKLPNESLHSWLNLAFNSDLFFNLMIYFSIENLQYIFILA